SVIEMQNNEDQLIKTITPLGLPVQLIPCPFPYKGMIAICSDIDGTSIDDFRNIHRYLNTQEETPIGRGVGLDIADSIWFYKMRGDSQMAFFTDHSWNSPSIEAEELIYYAKMGWIDTIHTYGNFNLQPGIAVEFIREHAIRALEILQKDDV